MFIKAEQKAQWRARSYPLQVGFPCIENDVCREIRCTCYEISDQYHLISNKIGNISTAAVITCSLQQNETGILQIASAKNHRHIGSFSKPGVKCDYTRRMRLCHKKWPKSHLIKSPCHKTSVSGIKFTPKSQTVVGW